MSPSERTGAAPVPVFCGHCGAERAVGRHDACAARLELEPPRFCERCRRRMVVQVIPREWTATCAEHGTLSGG